nr:PREDICTED: histone H3.v1-like [Paralichthys olivaceus]
MDVQQQNRPYLEPIQEESEQEDETGGSGTEGEEDFQSEVGVEMEEEVAEEEEEEEEEEDEDDDDAPLRVLRPRRLSRSLSNSESFLQSHSADSHQRDLDNSSVSDAVDLSDEAESSWQQKLGNEKQAIGRGLKGKNLKTPETSVQRKRKRKSHKKTSQCLFPPWVVELMVNIEEAKKHRLVVE